MTHTPTPLRAYEEAEARLEHDRNLTTAAYEDVVRMFAMQRMIAVRHVQRAAFWRGLTLVSWLLFALSFLVGWLRHAGGP